MSRRAKNVVVIFVAEVTLTLFDERAGHAGDTWNFRCPPYVPCYQRHTRPTQGQCQATQSQHSCVGFSSKHCCVAS